MARGVLAVVLAVVVSTCSAARILGVFPLPSPSHKQLYLPLMEALASRGHHVTVISPFEVKAGSNVTVIKIAFERNSMQGNFQVLFSDMNVFVKFFYVCSSVTALTEAALSSPEVMRFIQTADQHFDLVVTLSGVGNALLAFGRLFAAPIITVCPTLGFHSAEEMLGNEVNPSYVPHIFVPFSDRMTFYERTFNLLFSWWDKLLLRFYVSPAQDAIMRKHFRAVELPPLTELNADVALNFINIVPGINYPRPLSPNMVAVGGLHVLPPRPLPQDTRQFLDEATEGAVLFSLGSNVRSADLSNETRQIILKVFSKLKQRVLWKFETDHLEGLPSNVKIWKWLPQNDVLAHPNLKAFVTHGGQLSGLEALYHGVPVVVVPFFADQPLNAEFAQRSGFGIALQLSDISEDSLHHALSQILYNSSYGEKAAFLSRVFRDQPQSALERAVFWTEYVLRHKGAPHLRPAAADLAWFQLSLLDVAAVLLLVPSALACCTVLLCKRLFCSSKRTTVADEKKAKKIKKA